MSYQPSPNPILHCLNQRASALGLPRSWEWVINDPLVGCFSPALFLMAENGAIDISAELRQKSKEIYWQTTAHWVMREHKLIEICEELDRAGIDYIPLKGALLIRTLYKKAGLRPFVDIDLLVRPADFLRTAKLLLSLGMQPTWFIQGDDVFAFSRLPKKHWPRELGFGNKGILNIDLHGALITTKWFDIAFPVQNEALWARSQSLETQQQDAEQVKGTLWQRTLSPYDTLAHLCFHLGAHGLGIIKNFFDVDQFIRQLPNNWLWEHYLEIAREWQVCTCSYHVFSYCIELFNTPIPSEVIHALSPGRFARWWTARLITAETLIAGHPTLGRKYPTLVKFALIDTFALKVRTLIKLLLTKSRWHQDQSSAKTIIGHWRHVIKVILRGD